MKRIFFLLLFIACLASSSLFAQDSLKVAKNSVWVGGGAEGFGISANYERTLIDKGFKINGRLGFSYPFVNFSERWGLPEYVIPLAINGVFFQGKHHLETAIGTSISFGPIIMTEYIPTGTVGYRFEPKKGGLLVKVSYTSSLVLYSSGLKYEFSVGGGLGYSF